jgi:hypothetical protein
LDYNSRVDVFLTSEARSDLETLRILRPVPGTWGLLFGHERGFRVFVEKAFPAGRSGFPTNERVMELDRLWNGRVVGFFALRPAASFRKRLLGPDFFGKLYLEIGISGSRTRLKAYAVEHKRGFILSVLPLESGPKERNRD